VAAISLTDLVLLGSNFEMWPQGAASPPSPDDNSSFQYPKGDHLDLSAEVARDGGQLVLFLTASIDDPSFPFRLNVVIGARFDVPDETLEEQRAEGTLVWLCYPYLRELIASITGRSPLPPYYLPGLAKLPHPSVVGPEVAEGSDT
jgi:hypothetical protein